MPLIGTRTLAREAMDAKSTTGKGLSDDWQVLKQWGCRFVVHHKPSGVVYKVDDGERSYRKEALDNKTELRNARTLRRRSDDGFISAYVRIPRVSGFTFGNQLVIAMEFVEGTIGNDARHAIPEAAKRELLALGFNDMHPYNFIWSGGYIWPVDMGSARSQRVTTRNYEVDQRCLW